MSSFDLDKIILDARMAISGSFGTDDGEHGSNLYVSHHLAELESSYWLEHFGSEKPEPLDILNGLLVKPIETEEDLENIDFILPGKVSDYVLAVYLNREFQVEEIAMES